MKVFCDDKVYRQRIAELATSVYHLTLHRPQEDAEQGDLVEYLDRVGVLEKQVNKRAANLSKKFKVPIELVHRDITECIDFLPKEDLDQSLREREKDRLH